MGVCWTDYDNDGAEDLYIANMWTAAGERIASQEVFKKDAPPQVRNLYRKHAMGIRCFEKTRVTRPSTILPAGGRRNGPLAWSSDAWDFDHDGFPDLYIANGMVSGRRARI